MRVVWSVALVLGGIQSFAKARADDGIKTVDCTTIETTERMVYGDRDFPRKGRLFMESHLATVEDEFEDDRHFPENKIEGINTHTRRTCAMLQELYPDVDCERIYREKWSRQWTPPEHGLAGQGARGGEKPTILEEAFTFNMNWKKAPRAGTRYLLTNGNQTVVAVAGYEIGPNNEEILGGVQPELAYFLKINDDSKVEVARLKDQTLRPGPVHCRSVKKSEQKADKKSDEKDDDKKADDKKADDKKDDVVKAPPVKAEAPKPEAPQEAPKKGFFNWPHKKKASE